jgi:hypothetical protein
VTGSQAARLNASVTTRHCGRAVDFTNEQHGGGPEHWAAVLAGGTILELYPGAPDRRTGQVRIGFAVRADTAGLMPGRHLVQDPEGRTVEITAE